MLKQRVTPLLILFLFVDSGILRAQSPEKFDDFALCSFGNPDRLQSGKNYKVYIMKRGKALQDSFHDVEKLKPDSASQFQQQLAQILDQKALTESAGAQEISNDLAGVSCSQSLLNWSETKNVYGRPIAGQYIAVEVTVRNLDPDHEFLLHQVQLAMDAARDVPGRSWVEARGKRVARGVLERGQETSFRNSTIRILELVGATASSAALVASADFANGTQIFNGGFLPGIRHALPDLIIRQLNRFDDTAFDSGSILVPKRGAISFVTFVNQAVFGHMLRTDNKGKTKTVGFKQFSGEELLQFQGQITVVVSGAHVQEVSTKPAISTFDPESLSRQTSTKQKIYIVGSELNRVTGVKFRVHPDTGGTPIDSAQEIPLNNPKHSGSMATIEVTPNDSKIFPQFPNSKDPTKYKIVLIFQDGTSQETSKEFTLDP